MKLKDYLKETKIKSWEDFEAPFYLSMDVANQAIEPDNREMNEALTFLKTFCDPRQETEVFDAFASWDVPLEVAQNVLGVCHCNMGGMYYVGNVVGHDLQRARDHYEHGFRLGDTQAACNLGYLYEEGEFADPPRAFACFAYAAANGNLNGIYKMGDCYDKGIHVERDPFKAFAIWNACENLMRLAEDTTYKAEVAFRIARKYDEADGVSENIHAAYNYHEIAANAAAERAEAGDETVRELYDYATKRLDDLRDDPEFVVKK